ncbi:MAG: hypothetical protein ACJ8EY_03210, partial [Sphingomicrobium sp.]
MPSLPAALREPRHPLRAIAAGWLLACPVSLALSALAHWLFPTAEQPDFGTIGPVTVGLLVM